MREDKTVDGPGSIGFSRRSLLSGAAAAGAAGTFGFSVLMPVDKALAEQVEALKADGWEAHPCACNVCGGYCGLLAMHKKGAPVSQETVRIMPNPTHPQRGCCARGAQAMWVWNHPMRLKKPLKRVGARGDGKFQEISWDQALNEIAERVKAIVEKDGERAVTMSSHNFSAMQKWFGCALGTPNVISHSSTCNSASIAGRRMVFGKGFDGAGKVEPDYARAKYLLCVGRTLNCAIGVAAVVARAKTEGTKVVFVDPRMPEGALTGSEWIPIRPGADSAFLLSLIHIGITEKLVDFEFLRRHTNAPYLVETGTRRPIAASEIIAGAPEDAFVVMDRKTASYVVMGLKKDDKGNAVGFAEPEGVDPELDHAARITALDGRELEAETCFPGIRGIGSALDAAGSCAHNRYSGRNDHSRCA